MTSGSSSLSRAASSLCKVKRIDLPQINLSAKLALRPHVHVGITQCRRVTRAHSRAPRDVPLVRRGAACPALGQLGSWPPRASSAARRGPPQRLPGDGDCLLSPGPLSGCRDALPRRGCYTVAHAVPRRAGLGRAVLRCDRNMRRIVDLVMKHVM